MVLKEFGFSTISANSTHMTLTSIRSSDGKILDTAEFEKYLQSFGGVDDGLKFDHVSQV